MKLSLKKTLLPFLILAVAVGGAAALIATKPKAKPVEVTEKAWLVSAVAVEPGTYAPTLPLYGRVESLWSSSLTAGLAADVVEVPVIEGDEVAAGDLLVRLDDRDAALLLAQREAELAEAEARIAAENTQHQADLDSLPRERRLLELVEAELKRTEDLVRKKAGSQSTLDTARQAVERQAITLTAREQGIAGHASRLAELEARRAKAGALRDQARLELERTRITAPFAGRIARVLVAPGKRVKLGCCWGTEPTRTEPLAFYSKDRFMCAPSFRRDAGRSDNTWSSPAPRRTSSRSWAGKRRSLGSSNSGRS